MFAGRIHSPDTPDRPQKVVLAHILTHLLSKAESLLPVLFEKVIFYLVLKYVQFLKMEPPWQTTWWCTVLNARKFLLLFSLTLFGCNLISSLIVLPAARTEFSPLLLQKPIHSRRSSLHSIINFQSTTRKLIATVSSYLFVQTSDAQSLFVKKRWGGFYFINSKHPLIPSSF